VDWASDKGCPSGESVSLLTVFNRQGDIISQTTEELGSFTWLPDNRLVYENNAAIYVATAPYQVESDAPRLNNPLWSPEGDKIITMEGYFSGVGVVYDDLDLNRDSDYIVVPIDRKGLTYVVPANENEVKLPPNGELQASILSVLDSNGAIPFVESVDSHLFLVPSTQTPSEIAGSLPADNPNQINRGIGGNIFFINESQGDTVVSALSVDSGVVTDIVTLSPDEHDEYYIDFSMSNDKQYFAFYDYEYLDDKHIKLFNSSGELIRQYTMDTDSYDISPSGRIHFSPIKYEFIAVRV
jgi:hypothetical protein